MKEFLEPMYPLLRVLVIISLTSLAGIYIHSFIPVVVLVYWVLSDNNMIVNNKKKSNPNLNE